jgi:hypothetical protein
MEGRRNEERRRAHAEETGPGPPTISVAEEDEGGHVRVATTAERQRSNQGEREDRGHHQVQSMGRQSTGQPQEVNACTNTNDGEANNGRETPQQDSRTQLQELRDALRRRFGQQAIRSEAVITGNMEHTDGTSFETLEQRRLRLGKAPMEPQELRNGEILQTQEIPIEPH